jgi:CheY-like chemotaxis protein
VPSFLGHPPELREVLTNLIFNAVDAMPKGGVLRFTTSSNEGQIRIAVGDTGVGMTEEECSRCLEPFYTTKGQQGTGLGLAAVYGFVQRYGGAIGIKSTKGEGSVFTLTLPGSTPLHRRPDPAQKVVQRFLRVLVVDDQEIIRQLIAELLEAEGHFALPVADGVEALRQLSSGHWDLVISDQSMPEMTGSQVAMEMRRRNLRAPFILLTGFGDEMRAKGGKPEGVDLLLSKPVTASGLREALKVAVGGL